MGLFRCVLVSSLGLGPLLKLSKSRTEIEISSSHLPFNSYLTTFLSQSTFFFKMYLDVLLVGALALGLGSATPASKSATNLPSFPRTPSPNVNTTNFFSLTRHVKHHKHHKRSGHQGIGIAPLTTNSVQLAWLVDVEIGQQTVKLQVDTGSADTWVINATYSCFAVSNDTYGEITNVSLPQSACDFGPGYKAGKEHKLITDEHFYIWYGNGETIYGEFGKVPITVGGLT